MPSGYGFVAPPTGNPGFFEYQEPAKPEPPRNYQPQEPDPWNQDQSWANPDDSASIPFRQPENGPITPDSYPDRNNTPYSSAPQPPGPPMYPRDDRASVPILRGRTGPITPDTQPPAREWRTPEIPPVQPPSTGYRVPDRPSVPIMQGQPRLITPDTQRPAREWRTPDITPVQPPSTGYQVPDRPSVPIYSGPNYPIVPTSTESAPLRVSPPPPVVQQPRDTGQPTVPIHEPDLSPIVPTGPEQPVWALHPKHDQQPAQQPRDDGGPTVVLHDDTLTPILPPSGPPKPVWITHRSPDDVPKESRSNDAASVPIRQFKLQPVLPPKGPPEPVWVDYPRWGGSSGGGQPERSHTESGSNDAASVPIHQLKLQPVLPPEGPGKPVWVEYPNWRGHSGGDEQDRSPNDIPSVPIGGQHSPIVPKGPEKPVWDLYSNSHQQPSGPRYAKDQPSTKIRSQTQPIVPRGPPKPIWEEYRSNPAPKSSYDPPSVKIGEKADQKLTGSGKDKTATWKPVKPITHKDNPSVQIGDNKQKVYKLIPAEDEPKPEVIILHPEKPPKEDEIVKLYREDPNEEPDLWVHPTAMTSNKHGTRGPYVTKLVVSDTGRIPLTPVTPSSCSRARNNDIRSGYLTRYSPTGTNQSETYTSQCNG